MQFFIGQIFRVLNIEQKIYPSSHTAVQRSKYAKFVHTGKRDFVEQEIAYMTPQCDHLL